MCVCPTLDPPRGAEALLVSAALFVLRDVKQPSLFYC